MVFARNLDVTFPDDHAGCNVREAMQLDLDLRIELDPFGAA
jgi:hypothetical protein